MGLDESKRSIADPSQRAMRELAGAGSAAAIGAGLLVGFAAGLVPASVLAAPGDFREDDAEAVWHRSGDAGSSYGWAIARIDDVNGDGVAELAVGAPNHVGVDGAAGRVQLLSGADGAVLWTVDGEAGDRLGYALADAGDVDGDGIHDVVIGAPGTDMNAGALRLRSGIDGSVLLDIPSPEPGAFLGAAVAGAGDLNGDGQPDVIAGAERADGTDQQANGGVVWAFRGGGGTVLWEARGDAGARLGSATAFVGDLDGDGVPDPFVGASDAGAENVGAARVLDGSDGTVRFTLAPDGDGRDFGRFFVASAGDVDGDATPDLYVGDFGAVAAGAGAGRVHIYAGADGAPLETIDGAGPGEGFGPGRGAGDVDFDGVPDLIVGAYASSAGAPQAGRVFVLSLATGTALRTFTSLEAGEQLGFDAVGLGDVDGDGDLDFAVSAAGGDNVYVLEGDGGPPPPDGDTSTGGASTGDASTEGTHANDDGDVAAGPDPSGASGCRCDASSPGRMTWPGLMCLLLTGLALVPLWIRRA